MKSKIVLSVLSVLFAVAVPYLASSQRAVAADDQKVLYYSCPMHPSVRSDKPGNCPQCGMELQAVYGSDSVTNDAASLMTNGMAAIPAKPKPYPLDICIVSGEKLGEMGKPIVFVYTTTNVNQEIKFCCTMCKPKFLKDPDTYLKKLTAAEAAQKK
jgi:hypothetical protein